LFEYNNTTSLNLDLINNMPINKTIIDFAMNIISLPIDHQHLEWDHNHLRRTDPHMYQLIEHCLLILHNDDDFGKSL